ncbi:MAG: hypothetical protein IT449_04820 [Phycisphaerales bacterium]|nr:hypothetical protein [Phycisphaerales bacterium]
MEDTPYSLTVSADGVEEDVRDLIGVPIVTFSGPFTRTDTPVSIQVTDDGVTVDGSVEIEGLGFVFTGTSTMTIKRLDSMTLSYYVFTDARDPSVGVYLTIVETAVLTR